MYLSFSGKTLYQVKMKTVTFSCFLFAILVACGNPKNYNGYHMLSMKADTENQLTYLRQLQHNDKLNFMHEPSRHVSTDVIVPPALVDQLKNDLSKAAIAVTVKSTNLQAEIDAERRDNLEKQQSARLHGKNFIMDHNVYRNLSEVIRIMGLFQSAFPTVARMKQMKNATQGFEIPVYYMELGRSSTNHVIFVEGLAHAREWITTASLLYVIHQLLQGYLKEKPEEMNALTNFTWIIIPVLNPDGYKYTWEADRFWRKNRRKHSGGNCFGVDLNRNFDAHFGEAGVSYNCLWDSYCGPNAFSESETRNVADLFRKLKNKVTAYVSVHSYGQYVLYPWGYASSDDNDIPSNCEKLVRVGNKIKEKLEIHQKKYTIGTVFDHFGYAVSGSSMDWAMIEKPGIYSYSLELSPVFTNISGMFGFIINRSEIETIGKELHEALLELSRHMSRKNP